MFAQLIFAVIGTLVGTGLLWVSSRRLEDASHRLATHYHVPDSVKGATLTAASSSFPELATALLATLAHADFSLGLSAVIGSAIFNVLAIPAASVFVIRKELAVNRAVVYRETQFYLVAVAVLFLALSLGVIYNGIDAADGSPVIRGQFTWQLALIPLALYGLYIFIQYEEVRDHRNENGVVAPQLWALETPVREWMALLVSMGAIFLGVEVLLRAVLTLGTLLDTPSFFWGLTVLAAATSVPDMFVSMRAAEKGRSDSAISNALGSNVFDLLVAVPVAVLVAGSVTINFSQIVPMMGFLVAATVGTLVFLRRDMRLTIAEARLMMLFYGVFALWMLAEALGLVSFLAATPV